MRCVAAWNAQAANGVRIEATITSRANGSVSTSRATDVRPFLAGVGIGWIVTPLIVLFASAAHGTTDGSWVVPALAGGLVAAGTGFAIGSLSLGWAGFGGATVGAVIELVGAYLVVPPLLGLVGAPLGEAYGDYLPGVVGAIGVAAFGTWLGGRTPWRLTVPSWPIVLVGVVVLVCWFGFWLVVGRSIAVPA